MALLPTNVNYDEIEAQGEYEVLPAGEYLAVITSSEKKPTKAGTGSYIEFKFQILEGEHKNRVVFDRLNLDNPNPKAVEIAFRTLKSILLATGVHNPKDTAELHDIPVLIKVVVRPETADFGESNDIKSYKSAPGGVQQGIDKKSAPANKGKKPWER